MQRNQPPEPWRSFFLDIDAALDQSVVLQCIGGFAIAMLYGLPRPTVDVDFLSVVPAGVMGRLEALAGMGSALHGKHGVYVQHVGIVTVPESYEDRLIPIFPDAYRKVHLTGLEAHDLALSKLERNSGRDREDVKFLARAVPLNLTTLEDRYRSELRPYLAAAERHDLTMRLWIEMLQPR
ncbi:MAG: DUF6036 family nucleotidyltransferase [Bryobacteraceae bacterium]